MEKNKKIRMLLGGFGLAGALVLSACAGGDSGAGSAAGSGDFPEPNGGTVSLYNWTDYIDPGVLRKFEEETGITVILDNYDSNETLLARLQAGGASYDVIVPGDYMVAQMIELGLLLDVDPASFPNGGNVKDEFRGQYYDPELKYTVPYMYGTTGIAYDPTQTGGEISTWAEFFDPASPAAGRIGTLNDQIEVVHAALRAVGAEPCSENRDDYIKVDALLSGWKPGLAVINSDGVIGRMASGEQVMHMMWNGAFTRAKADNPNLLYLYPEEGITLWSDHFAVPVGAQNVDNAKIFINWMMDPENIGEATNFVGYDNGIKGSDVYMDAELGQNDAVIIPSEFLSRTQAIPGCSLDAIDLYDQVWTAFRR
jgi:spermidine/putrescine transport system substrate-binding protein